MEALTIIITINNETQLSPKYLADISSIIVCDLFSIACIVYFMFGYYTNTQVEMLHSFVIIRITKPRLVHSNVVTSV